jgi:hypothetical protein
MTAMITPFRIDPKRICLFLAIVYLSAEVRSPAAPTASDTPFHLPVQDFRPLPGKIVGVLASNCQAVLANEGRKGPADALTFGAGSGSQRWIYLPNQPKPLIGAMLFAVGEDNSQKKRFDRLNLATLGALKSAGISEPFTLVEVEVNGGLGCPETQAFVATKVHSVEGSKRYPLRVSEVVVRLQRKFEEWKTTKSQSFELALAAQRKALGWLARKGTKRGEEQLLYATWIPDRMVLQVQIRIRLQENDPLPASSAHRNQGEDGSRPEAKLSRSLGVEAGMEYEITRFGKIERAEPIPLKAFSHSPLQADNSRIARSR